MNPRLRRLARLAPAIPVTNSPLVDAQGQSVDVLLDIVAWEIVAWATLHARQEPQGLPAQARVPGAELQRSLDGLREIARCTGETGTAWAGRVEQVLKTASGCRQFNGRDRERALLDAYALALRPLALGVASGVSLA